MESKAYYIKNILKTLGLCGIGLFLGKYLFTGFAPFAGSAFITAAVFAGLPFGWRATTGIFSGIHGLGLITMLLYYVLRLGTSLAIGWAVMLYRLGKDVAQLVMLWRMDAKTGKENTAG